MNSTRCRTLAAAAGALAMLVAGAAGAQQAGGAGEQQQSAARNLYVGLAYGQSNAKKACDGLAACEDNDNSFGAFAGYWLKPALAIEGGYHNLGAASAPGGTFVRSHAWEVLGLGGVRPGEGPYLLYGKLGVARGIQEGGGARMAPKQFTYSVTYGAGIQGDMGRRFSVRAEWQRYPRLGGGPVLPAGDIDVIRLAALWRFR